MSIRGRRGDLFFLLLIKASTFLIVLSFFFPADAIDSLDPNGSITIKWDIKELNGGQQGYTALVTLFNYQQYRHIEHPGWRLSWEWPKDEVIWAMFGAEATEQGNCSRFKSNLPHSCEKKPVIIDLLPGTPYNQQTQNCCKGGVLSSMKQNPSRYVASFQITVGDTVLDDKQRVPRPQNFDLGVSGYTCGPARNVQPTKFPVDGGRRRVQALQTFQSTCSYSQTKASSYTCCVSLSSFYNETVVQCPNCACGCPDPSTSTKCAREGEKPQILQLPHGEEEPVQRLLRCTQHMCPIRVHWHVKTSYKEYWRVKMTVTNFNLVKNFSEWNLVVEHPNLESLTQVFSFNYAPLNPYPGFNNSGVFWGIQYYNDMLLQEGDSGNVQTEMLLNKDPGVFTFDAGWAFPRKIYFNGDICIMPLPDNYPRLPNRSSSHDRLYHLSSWLLPLLLFMAVLFS